MLNESFFTHIKTNNEALTGIISKLYSIQGTKITKAITIGNKTVQQKDINWSKRIRGKEARTHTKMNIIIHDFTPKARLDISPSIRGSSVTEVSEPLLVKSNQVSKLINCTK